MKILISQNPNGEVIVSYNSLDYLDQRSEIPRELMQNLAAVKLMAEKAACGRTGSCCEPKMEIPVDNP